MNEAKRQHSAFLLAAMDKIDPLYVNGCIEPIYIDEKQYLPVKYHMYLAAMLMASENAFAATKGQDKTEWKNAFITDLIPHARWLNLLGQDISSYETETRAMIEELIARNNRDEFKEYYKMIDAWKQKYVQSKSTSTAP